MPDPVRASRRGIRTQMHNPRRVAPPPSSQRAGARTITRHRRHSTAKRIKLGAFAALDQRIALRYAMAGMDLAETGSYIAHHLTLAGRADTLFSDDALGLIHQVSPGLPRAVNNLAVQSLVAAFADNKAIVDESSARAAITEVTAE
jgi:hypothetical protein